MLLLKKIYPLFEKVKDFILRPISAKKFACTFLLVFFGFFILWTAAVFLLDPYIYYHRAWGVKNVYRNSRAMVPGVLRHFEYDTVIFGTSMCQNFKRSEINEILQVNCVKATTAGLSSIRLSRYFDIASKYQKGKFKRALVGVDFWSFTGKEENGPLAYHYLYEERPFPLPYFYSADTAEALWSMVRSNIAQDFYYVAKHEVNEDLMFSNKPRYKYSRERLERDVRHLKDSPDVLGEDTKKRFEEHFLVHIRKNPSVQFDLFLPPYSIYFWCFLKSHGKLDSYLAMRDYMAKAVSQYPNVRLHDFQADFDIACQFDNYKDVTHYSPAINTVIINKIKSGSNIFSLEVFRKRTAQIRARSAEYQPAFDALRTKRKR